MSAEAKEFVLADLAALKVDGRCIVFLRSRRDLDRDELTMFESSASWLNRLVPLVTFVMLPHDVEVMAVGEAEMRQLGWTKIDISPNDKST